MLTKTGTKGGSVFDLEVYPQDTKSARKPIEKNCVQVFNGTEPITGLSYIIISQKLVAFMTTPSTVYQFIGRSDIVFKIS